MNSSNNNRLFFCGVEFYGLLYENDHVRNNNNNNIGSNRYDDFNTNHSSISPPELLNSLQMPVESGVDIHDYDNGNNNDNISSNGYDDDGGINNNSIPPESLSSLHTLAQSDDVTCDHYVDNDNHNTSSDFTDTNTNNNSPIELPNFTRTEFSVAWDISSGNRLVAEPNTTTSVNAISSTTEISSPVVTAPTSTLPTNLDGNYDNHHNITRVDTAESPTSTLKTEASPIIMTPTSFMASIMRQYPTSPESISSSLINKTTISSLESKLSFITSPRSRVTKSPTLNEKSVVTTPSIIRNSFEDDKVTSARSCLSPLPPLDKLKLSLQYTESTVSESPRSKTEVNEMDDYLYDFNSSPINTITSFKT